MAITKKNIVRCGKMTFWNKLRVQNNFSIKDVADYVGAAPGTIGGWFSGAKIPSDRYLESICNMFDIDLNKGYEEFAKASKEWDSERGKLKMGMYGESSEVSADVESPKEEKRKSGITITKSKVTDKSDAPVDEVVVPSVTITHTHKAVVAEDTKVPELFRYLYGKLTFDEYEDLKAAVAIGADPLYEVYGKIPYTEYNEVLRIMGYYSSPYMLPLPV